MMTFKAIAAALALLPVLTGAIHGGPQAEAAGMEQRNEHRALDPAFSNDSAHKDLQITDAVDTAKRAAPMHAPEPKVLLLIGTALLLFGLRRNGRRSRNSS